MSKEIRLKRGLNINLVGEADKVYANVKSSKKYVVKPTDFHDLTPKLAVKEGQKVKAGSVLFYDKYIEQVKYCSPVSGEVVGIERGAKRKILKVIVEADSDQQYEQFQKGDSNILNRQQIIEAMLDSGVWPFIRQKPYDIVANPTDIPKAIFISAFDSAPLAIDNDFALYGMEELFQKGLDFIVKLTDGETHLNIDGNTNPSKVFTEAKGVTINKVSGPHPAGNVGVQIHHIDPINKGDVIWYIQPQDVIIIARLFDQGRYDVSRIISLSGAGVMKPRYYRTIVGSQITNILNDNVISGGYRVISGNILWLYWLRRTFPSDFHSIPSFESLMASHEELKEVGESLSMPRVVAHTKWAICNVCDGNGTHVNPSIDCGGLTQDDFDQDPEFAESYFSGRYDQTCSGCNGSGKVRIVDTHAKGFIRWVMDQVAEADAASWEYAQEVANERRWGC